MTKLLIPRREHFVRPELLSPAWTLTRTAAKRSVRSGVMRLGFELRLTISGDDLPRTQVSHSQDELIATQEEWRRALEGSVGAPSDVSK